MKTNAFHLEHNSADEHRSIARMLERSPRSNPTMTLAVVNGPDWKRSLPCRRRCGWDPSKHALLHGLVSRESSLGRRTHVVQEIWREVRCLVWKDWGMGAWLGALRVRQTIGIVDLLPRKAAKHKRSFALTGSALRQCSSPLFG